jgi:hypothetical protein
MSERGKQRFHMIAALFGASAIVEGIDAGGAVGLGMIFLGSMSVVAAVLHWRSKPQAKP